MSKRRTTRHDITLQLDMDRTSSALHAMDRAGDKVKIVSLVHGSYHCATFSQINLCKDIAQLFPTVHAHHLLESC
jgi:hypothetical protein